MALLRLVAFIVASCFVAAASSQAVFLQKACSTASCGSCSGGNCQCEDLVQGACYQQPLGGSGMAWCKKGHIVLRNFFVSNNCSGAFAESDNALDQCFPALQLSGYVEYECPSSYEDEVPAVPMKKVDTSRKAKELIIPGPKFIPHEDSFDINKHAPHLGVHHRFAMHQKDTLVTLKLGEGTSHRRVPSWVLTVGKAGTRLLGHTTTLNVTQLLEEAQGGAITLREKDGKSNLYVLRK